MKTIEQFMNENYLFGNEKFKIFKINNFNESKFLEKHFGSKWFEEEEWYNDNHLKNGLIKNFFALFIDNKTNDVNLVEIGGLYNVFTKEYDELELTFWTKKSMIRPWNSPKKRVYLNKDCELKEVYNYYIEKFNNYNKIEGINKNFNDLYIEDIIQYGKDKKVLIDTKGLNVIFLRLKNYKKFKNINNLNFDINNFNFIGNPSNITISFCHSGKFNFNNCTFNLKNEKFKFKELYLNDCVNLNDSKILN